MRKFFILTLLCFSGLSGCDFNQNPEEMDRLMKEDAGFKQMIGARDQAHRQIAIIKDDLLKKKSILDAQIEKQRAEYDRYAKAQNIKIEQYRGTIDANRNVLRHEIDTASAQLEAKSTELEGYQKTLSDVQKVLKESKGITLSPQEKKKWEERVLMLSEKIRPLTEEIQELRLQVRLKKQKTGYLK